MIIDDRGSYAAACGRKIRGREYCPESSIERALQEVDLAVCAADCAVAAVEVDNLIGAG